MALKDWVSYCKVTGRYNKDIEENPNYTVNNISYLIDRASKYSHNMQGIVEYMEKNKYSFNTILSILIALSDNEIDDSFAEKKMLDLLQFWERFKLTDDLSLKDQMLPWGKFITDNFGWKIQNRGFLQHVSDDIMYRVVNAGSYLRYRLAISTQDSSEMFRRSCGDTTEDLVQRYCDLLRLFQKSDEEDLMHGVSANYKGDILKTSADLNRTTSIAGGWGSKFDEHCDYKMKRLGLDIYSGVGMRRSYHFGRPAVLIDGKAKDDGIAERVAKGLAFNYADIVIIDDRHKVIYKDAADKTLPIEVVKKNLENALRKYPDTIALVGLQYLNDIALYGLDNEMIHKYLCSICEKIDSYDKQYLQFVEGCDQY